MAKPAKKIAKDFKSLAEVSELPQGETEILAAFLLGVDRVTLLTHPETPVPTVVLKKFRELERKRLDQWPIAYLTGRKEFFGYDFSVSPAVLVPRPETEMIVEEIISLADKPTTGNRKKLIVDLGTGSGAIIISAALEIKKTSAVFKKTLFTAVDISNQALKIASSNARTHGLEKKISFWRGDLLSPLRLDAESVSGLELIIAANLPYLTAKQIKSSASIKREPRLALEGGRDGLDPYRKLFSQLARLGSDLKATIFCEIDPAQAEKISALARKSFSPAQVSIRKDLSGNDRLAIIRIG